MSKSYRSAMDEIKMSDELKKKIMNASAKGEKQKGKLIRPVYVGIASGLAASFVLVFALHHAYIAPVEHPTQNEMAQASEPPESNTFELAKADEAVVDTADNAEKDTDITADSGNKKAQQQAAPVAKEKAKQQDTPVAKESAEVKIQDTSKAKETSTVSEAAPATAAERENTVPEENEQPAETEPEEIVVAAAKTMSEPAAEKAPASEESLPDMDNAAAMRSAAPRSGGGGGGGVVSRSDESASAGSSVAASAAMTQPTDDPTDEPTEEAE